MKHYPGYFSLLLCLAFFAPLARAEKVSAVQPLGDDNYSITVTATNKFTRDTEKLKAAGVESATRFCAKEGKQFKLLAATESKSMYGVGPMASTTLTFKAAAPGSADAVAPPIASSATDAFAADMMKLDDLHKRGILTDEEFASAKKKVLERLK